MTARLPPAQADQVPPLPTPGSRRLAGSRRLLRCHGAPLLRRPLAPASPRGRPRGPSQVRLRHLGTRPRGAGRPRRGEARRPFFVLRRSPWRDRGETEGRDWVVRGAGAPERPPIGGLCALGAKARRGGGRVSRRPSPDGLPAAPPAASLARRGQWPASPRRLGLPGSLPLGGRPSGKAPWGRGRRRPSVPSAARAPLCSARAWRGSASGGREVGGLKPVAPAGGAFRASALAARP